MSTDFIAKSMSEAIAAIAALRAELDIAYEHLHAAEAERNEAVSALRVQAQGGGMSDATTHYDPVESGAICHPKCAIAEIRRLREERDALRADAERLTWLLHNLSGAEMRRIGVVYSDSSTMRAAIDAARKGTA